MLVSLFRAKDNKPVAVNPAQVVHIMDGGTTQTHLYFIGGGESGPIPLTLSVKGNFKEVLARLNNGDDDE